MPQHYPKTQWTYAKTVEFLSSQNASPRLEWRQATGSTNADLVALAASEPLPHFTVLATANQTAGRGRLDRSWVTPPGKALAISVLLKPELLPSQSLENLSWVPLLAGLAVAEALDTSLPTGDESNPTSVKWPNDVLIDGLKVCGVLSELLPNSQGLVVGAGINVLQTREELPVPTATSLALAKATLPPQPEARASGAAAASSRKRRRQHCGSLNGHAAFRLFDAA